MKSRRHLVIYMAVSAAAASLASCGGSGNHTESSFSASLPMQVAVPGISSAVSYSFDLGAVDPATGIYYVTDRTNKSIDVLSLSPSPLASPVSQFKNKSFAGCNSGGESGGATNLPYIPMPGCTNIAITPGHTLVTNNDLDGPDGLDIVGSTLYVGDVNALWVMNKSTGALVGGTGKVAIANTGTQQGFRSDEGCFDAADHLYATALTGDPHTPFYTILDTTGAETGAALPTVLGYVLMNGPDGKSAAGLEACAFDTASGFMWLNNDGSTANPNGEINGIPIADLVAMRTTPLAGNKMVVFQGSAAGPFTQFNSAITAAAQCTLGSGGSCGPTAGKVIGLPPLCDPTGIALGAVAGQVGSMCRPGTFNLSMDFQIVNTATAPAVYNGTGFTTVVGAGGGDQVTYDAASNKWYLANSRGTSNGKSCFNGSVQACNLVPTLTVVDGTSHAILGQFASGNNAHSVAVGAGFVVMPFTNSSAAGGGASFPNGGLAVTPTF